jgi:uncharacterized protein YjdB
VKNSIKKTLVTLLTLALLVTLCVPAVNAKTTYITKSELKKEINELTKYINSGTAGSDDRYVLAMDYQALKLVPSLKGNEDFAYVGDSGKLNVSWKNMTDDINIKEYKGIKWSSSNKKVATVSSSGKIKFKKAGTVTITAKSITSGKTSKLKITVEKL